MLLLAVNVGGLGTLIASMASVISFKLYSAETAVVEPVETTRHHSYFAVFTAYNVVLLAVLGVVVYLI